MQQLTKTATEKTALKEISNLKISDLRKYILAENTNNSIKKLRRYTYDSKGKSVRHTDKVELPDCSFILPETKEEWKKLNDFVMKEVY